MRRIGLLASSIAALVVLLPAPGAMATHNPCPPGAVCIRVPCPPPATGYGWIWIGGHGLLGVDFTHCVAT
ncbi:MAG: hypothetical protein M3279_02395 [Actinomycetota bacterium]|nr:hypothetical protein [Actinomycetota bacterium]